MPAAAIKVEGLWKEYSVGSAKRHSTFYDLLGHTLQIPFTRSQMRGREPASAKRFYALRDVTFDVERGEVLGVVGRNGAGKSTLLKALSRITAPTKGRITLRGRVASLLEVGTGFHPELTGRDNIQLNATILGMGRREIARKFDQIVDFSGVERFLDTPVKRYSSGMYVRLAFAVAAHVEADILLIDEVLAVGDAEFQKRCLGLMGQVARDGRTVLFVSHNITALRNLCTQGLLLNGGGVESVGRIDNVLRQYGFSGAGRSGATADIAEPYPDKVAALRQVAVVADSARNSDELSVATPFNILARIEVREPNIEIAAFVSCFDSSQNCVFTSGSFFSPRLNGARLSVGLHEFNCRVPENLLNAGDYALDVALIRDRSEIVLRESAVVSFHVHDARPNIEGWHWPIQGVVRPLLQWSTTPIAGEEEVDRRTPSSLHGAIEAGLGV
jgi:homopolymeric O-antigen transport system ATP-binding protein